MHAWCGALGMLWGLSTQLQLLAGDSLIGRAAQVKKVRTVQAAFEAFSSMMKTQGRAELTALELRVSCLVAKAAAADLD